MSKATHRASNKAYYEANREQLLASQKIYRDANRGKIIAYKKAYYEANRKQISDYHKAHYKANRIHKEIYRETNRERMRSKYKAFREELVVSLGSECKCCGSKHKLEFDHIKPLRRKIKYVSDLDSISAVKKNPSLFQLLCRGCNQYKGTGPSCPCKYWDSISPGWRG